MTRNVAIAVAVLIVTLATGWFSPRLPQPARTIAQERTAESPAALNTATLDVSKALEGYQQFQRDMEALRAEVVEANQEVAVRQAEIESVAKELQGLQPGQPGYESKQLLLVRLQTELKQLVERDRQEFLVQEAGLYKQAYDQIRTEVRQVAANRGIRLVLRVNEGEVDARNPKAVADAVNQTVVYQDGLDITAEIVERLNQG